MIAFFKSIAAWLWSRKAELGHGVRVTLAATGALAIALALGLRLPLWAVLTAIIITQMSVGRSLKATRDYMIGTLGGAVYGAAVAILIPHSSEGALLAALVLAVAPLAFISAIDPWLNPATVTAIIVLLLPVMSHGTVLDSAIDRVLEVTVGTVTGLLVSFLVLPSRAHGLIRATAPRMLELMASALHELLSGMTRGRDNAALQTLQDGIGAELAGLNAIGAEAERERAAHLSSGPDTGPLLRTVLRLRHDLVMIGRASVLPLPAELQRLMALPLKRVSDAIVDYLNAAAASLRMATLPPAIAPVQDALQAYAAAVASARSEGLTTGLAGDVVERFFALGFSLEQMRRNLKDLERCVAAWADAPARSPAKMADEID